MGVNSALRRGRSPRAVLYAVVIALMPWSSAMAAEAERSGSTSPPTVTAVPTAAPASGTPSLRNAIDNVDVRKIVTPAKSRAAARRSSQGNPATDSPSFFKTPTGIAVLAVMIAGTAYAIYSTQNDRINSPGKE